MRGKNSSFTPSSSINTMQRGKNGYTSILQPPCAVCNQSCSICRSGSFCIPPSDWTGATCHLHSRLNRVCERGGHPSCSTVWVTGKRDAAAGRLIGLLVSWSVGRLVIFLLHQCHHPAALPSTNDASTSAFHSALRSFQSAPPTDVLLLRIY